MSEENYLKHLKEINALGEFVGENPFDLGSALAKGVLESKHTRIQIEIKSGSLTETEAEKLRTAISEAIDPQ